MRITIANLKGGTGKTTTSVNLSASLALDGFRVLLVDMDPLADATIYTGFDPDSCGKTISDVLFRGRNVRDVLMKTRTPNLDFISASLEMSNTDLELAEVKGRETLLSNSLRDVDDEYDYILIDAPPGLNLLQVNCLMACDQIVIPTFPSFLSVRGLQQLTKVLTTIKNTMHHDVKILGILLTFVDAKTKGVEDVADKLREKFGVKVFDTAIRKSVGLGECPSLGQTIFEYDPESIGAQCYRELARELRQKTAGPVSIVE
jgi:chromosome partitioning protein